MSDEDFNQLSSSVTKRQFKVGETIIKQGDKGDSMFLVTEGVVQVIIEDPKGKEIIIDNLTIGEVFGEMTLLTGSKRSATVKAIRPVVLFEISKEVFEKVLKANVKVITADLWLKSRALSRQSYPIQNFKPLSLAPENQTSVKPKNSLLSTGFAFANPSFIKSNIYNGLCLGCTDIVSYVINPPLLKLVLFLE